MPSAPTKKKRIQWIIILIVVLSFIVGIQIYTGDRDQPLSYQKEKLSKTKTPKEMEAAEDSLHFSDEMKADNYEEVFNFYEKQAPGLKRAEHNDLTTFPKQSVPVPDHEGNLYINEIWDSGRKIYFLYSIDLSVLEDKPFQKFPSVENVHLEPLTASSEFDKEFSSTYMMSLRNSGMVFNHKLYSIAVLGHSNNENKEMPPQPVDETVLASFNIELPKGFYTTDPVAINLHYNPDEMHVETLSLKGKYQKNGVTIKPIELNVGMASMSLKLRIDSQEELTPNIFGSLVTKEGKERRFHNLEKVKGQNHIYQVQMQPISQELTGGAIQIDGITYRKEKGFSFDVDLSDYQDQNLTDDGSVSKKMHKKLKQLDHTEIFLDRKSYTREGMDLNLKFKPMKEEQTVSLAASTMADFNEEEQRKRKIRVLTNSGEERKAVYGGSKKQMSIYLNDRIIKDASKITITFDETTYYQKINHSFQIKD